MNGEYYTVECKTGTPVCSCGNVMRLICGHCWGCDCGGSTICQADGTYWHRESLSDPAAVAAHLAAEESGEEHARRWAAATNDPNGNY